METDFTRSVKHAVNAAMNNISNEILAKESIGQYRLTVGLMFAGSTGELSSAISTEIASRLSDMKKEGRIDLFLMAADKDGANIEIFLHGWDAQNASV